jgi:hypothetical protein
MSTNPRFEGFLQRIDPNRRDALRKILAGTVVYSAPLIASFSMSSLDGVAQAQLRNQTGQAIPASSGWTLAALTAAIGAAAAFVLRRRRDR